MSSSLFLFKRVRTPWHRKQPTCLSFFSTTKKKTVARPPNKSLPPHDNPSKTADPRISKRHNSHPQRETIINCLTLKQPVNPTATTCPDATTTTTTTARSILDDVDRRMKRERPHRHIPPSLVSMANSTIFEMFQVPEPPPPRPANAFPSKGWEQYETTLKQVLARHQEEEEQQQKSTTRRKKKKELLHDAMRDWLHRETATVPVSLPLLEHRLQHGHEDSYNHTTNEHESDEFRQQIQLQQQTFASSSTTTTPAQIQAAQGVLYQVSCQCARKGWGWAVQVLWPKVKETGMTNDKLLHNLLYLSSLQQKRKQDDVTSLLFLHVMDSDHTNDTMNEIAWYHDLLYQPVAQSIQARVQWFVEQGQAAAAERWLDQIIDGEDVRLRVYTPILKLYLEQGEFQEAIRLYRHMRHTLPLVHFQVETYWLLLSTLASEGYFASQKDGNELFHSIVQEMADDPNVMELPMNAAIRLRNAFADCYKEDLSRISALQPLPLITGSSATTSTSRSIVAERVQIDSTTGKCPVTHVQLRLLRLTVEQRKELRMRLLDLAQDNARQFVQIVQSSTKRQQNTDRSSKTDNNNAPLLDFMTFLQERSGPPFTIIVDGANVGYYMQNFQQGRFSFHQIQWMVDDLKRRDEHALVVLPQKYMRDDFYISVGVGGFDQRRSPRQVLTDEEKEIRDRLVAQKQVYVVQPGSLDDFYWITASVTDQTNAIANNGSSSSSSTITRGEELWVPPDNPEGRWPGARPLLISNDRMRDHKMSMMEPRLFRRWFSNYMVNYSFLAYVQGTSRARSDIHFLAADAYSREIQSNPLEDGRIAWHFPLQDTTDEWFCVVLPHQKEE